MAEHERLEKQINSLKSLLQTYPKGKLLCTRNGRHFKWFHRHDHKLSYIPKKNQALAEQLAAKQYFLLMSEDCIHEKNAIEQYLKLHDQSPSRAEKFLTEPSEYQRLLAPYFQSQSQEFHDWMNAPYDKNPKYPEQLTQKTISGHVVRSKSEALIAMTLHMHSIPFRYECALELGGVVVYPDFTIRHPQTGELYYWEHMGLMDDSNYVKNALNKQQLYISHGILPTHQLITTYESKNQPLDVDMVQKIVEYYFLQ